MIRILSDSCCDLSQQILDRYQIETIPLSVFINGKTYLDGPEIDSEFLFQQVQETGQLPKTSAPSLADFGKLFSSSEESIYIGLSSKLSATVPNAILAAQSFDSNRIRVIDSLNLSTGIGLLAIRAAELRDQGYSLDEIEKEITSLVPKVSTSMVLDTLEYVYMGGRCSAVQNIIGSLLKIRPVLEVRTDGTLGVREHSHGSRKKSLQSLIDNFKQHLPEIDLSRVFISHTGCPNDAEFLKNELKKIADIKEILITVAGAVISSHCGPKTIGILYLTR
jgi:DegV family protein with EDD domain